MAHSIIKICLILLAIIVPKPIVAGDCDCRVSEAKASDKKVSAKCASYKLDQVKCDKDPDCWFPCFGLRYNVKKEQTTVNFVADQDIPVMNTKIKMSKLSKSDESKLKTFAETVGANSFIAYSDSESGITRYDVDENQLAKVIKGINALKPNQKIETNELISLDVQQKKQYKIVMAELRKTISKTNRRLINAYNVSDYVYNNISSKRRLAFTDHDPDSQHGWALGIGAFATINAGNNNYNNGPFCSGMLLADQIHVITDAHCWCMWDRENKAINIINSNIHCIVRHTSDKKFIIGAKPIAHNSHPAHNKPPGKKYIGIDHVIINSNYYNGNGLNVDMTPMQWYNGVQHLFHYDFAIVRLKNPVSTNDAFGFNIDADYDTTSVADMFRLPEWITAGYPTAKHYQQVMDTFEPLPADQIPGIGDSKYQGHAAGLGFESRRLHMYHQVTGGGGQSGSPLLHFDQNGEVSSWGLLLGHGGDENDGGNMLILRFDAVVISTFCGYLNAYAIGEGAGDPSVIHASVTFYNNFCGGYNNPLNIRAWAVAHSEYDNMMDDDVKQEGNTYINNYYYPLKRDTYYYPWTSSANILIIFIFISFILIGCCIFAFCGVVSSIVGYYVAKINLVGLQSK